VVTSRAAWLHRVQAVPEWAKLCGFVAVADGAVIGESYGCLSLSGDGSHAVCSVIVDPGWRRRGVGTRLFEPVAARFSANLLARFHENDAGNAFASGLGFRHVRAEPESVLDVQAFQGSVPEGVDLRPLAATDPRDAYLADVEATLDMPATEEIQRMPYEEWEEHVLRSPLLAADGSFVAYADGEPAAVSLLVAANGRSANMFTGTRRAFRGRGLARAAKVASIVWAREHGIHEMATSNDETNAPMLAINRKLGFVPAGRRVEWLREGTASSPAPQAPAM
jgi:GNAT superfamily N-acetyltransferase